MEFGRPNALTESAHYLRHVSRATVKCSANDISIDNTLCFRVSDTAFNITSDATTMQLTSAASRLSLPSYLSTPELVALPTSGRSKST